MNIMVKKRIKKPAKGPSPTIVQRAAKAVLTGKCPLSKPTYLKLRKHRNIIRKLASMKGSTKKKQSYMRRHKKQVGGFLPFLPLIAGAVGSLVPKVLGGMLQ